MKTINYSVLQIEIKRKKLEPFYEREILEDFVRDCLTNGDKTIPMNFEKKNKAVFIEGIEPKYEGERAFYPLVLKSCKYGGSPNFVSSIDGSERVSDKQDYEGPKEVTRAVILVTNGGMAMMFESNRSGVGVDEMRFIFNDLFTQRCGDRLFFSYIPDKEFLEYLMKARRIKTAEVYLTDGTAGNHDLFAGFLEDEAEPGQIINVFKPSRGGSLSSNWALNVFRYRAKFNCSRLKLYIEDENGVSAMIDTDNEHKRTYLEVEDDVPLNDVRVLELFKQKVASEYGHRSFIMAAPDARLS